MSAKAMKVAKALINDEEHFSQIGDTSAKRSRQGDDSSISQKSFLTAANNMKLEIEINEGDDLTWLEVWRDHSAIVRDRAPKPKTRAMADKVFLALENALGKPINPSKGD